MSDNANVASASIFLVILVFVAASGATWVAGVELSKSTDELDRRLGFGDAIGGMVMLAIAGSLPELAITISAAESGHLGLAAGNLIGGIATATMVLVLCDLFAPRLSHFSSVPSCQCLRDCWLYSPCQWFSWVRCCQSRSS